MIQQSFDREAALERVGGDVDLLKEIAGLFIEDEKNMVSAIESAISAQDSKLLERSAHTLKGCVANFGAAEAFEASFRLEKLGRAGDWTGVPNSLRELNAALNQLRPELEAFRAG